MPSHAGFPVFGPVPHLSVARNPMLFTKALRRDLSNLAGVIFATLFTIMVTTTLIRLLGRAAGGNVDTASVLR